MATGCSVRELCGGCVAGAVYTAGLVVGWRSYTGRLYFILVGAVLGVSLLDNRLNDKWDRVWQCACRISGNIYILRRLARHDERKGKRRPDA